MITALRRLWTVARGNERGQVTVYALLLVPAMILAVGLVIDGSAKVAATQRAQTAAVGAARAASNAAATNALAGQQNNRAGAATLAGKAFLQQTGVPGSVSVQVGVIRVETHSSAKTQFLSMIGIGQLTGRGAAEASLVETGGSI